MLEELTLENFCQFKKLTVKFMPGTNMIGGRNGAGKSNCVGGLWFVLTGQSPLSGAKALCVRQGTGKSERSCGQLTFRIGKDLWTAIRHLRSDTAKLTREGDPPEKAVVGEREVTAKIRELLQADSQRLSHGVFASQLTELIDAGQLAFLGQMQKLFELGDMPKLREELLDEQKRVLQASPAVDETVPELQVALDGMRQELSQFETELATLPAYATMDERYSVLSNQVLQSTAAEKLLSQIETAERDLPGLRWNQTDLENRLTLAVNGAEEIRRFLENGEGEVQAIQAAVASAQQFMAYQRQTETYQKEIASLQNLLATTPEPQPPQGWEASWSAGDTMPMRVEIDSLKKVVAAATAGHVCPTCLRPFDGVQDVSAKAARLANLERNLARMQWEQDADRAYGKAVAEFRQWEQRAKERLAQTEGALAALHSVTPAAVPPGGHAKLEEHSKMQQNLKALDAAIAASRTRVNAATNAVQLKEQWIASMRQQVGTVLTTADVAAIQQELGGIYSNRARRRELEIAVSARSASINQLSQRIAKIQEDNVLANAAKAWCNEISLAREAFDKNAAPKLVVASNLLKLRNGVNASLSLFCVDFRLDVVDDVKLVASFFDGRQVAVEKLSRGQKTVLGVSLWISLHFMLAPNVGLLVMDEPTQFLDAYNVQAFVPVIERLKAISEANAMQFVIVTHETSLTPHFDNVIQIGS